MEPQEQTYYHSQDLINQAAFFILAGNIYGPEAQLTKGIAHALATTLKAAGYLDLATKNLLGTASLSMDDELAFPGGNIPDMDFAAAMYDTLYNVAAIHFGYFLEPTDNPKFEAKLREWATQSNQEP